MITVESSFEEILKKLGWDPGKRGRTYCKLHGGNNRYSFSYNEEKGIFHCFSCGAHGSKIDLVMQALNVSFKDALEFLGASNRNWRHPPAKTKRGRQENIRIGFERQCKRIGCQLRDEYYYRSKIISQAMARLRLDPEDDLGLKLAEIGFKGVALDELERLLEMINSASDEQRLRAWRALRPMGKAI